jgi:hypothetical protein
MRHILVMAAVLSALIGCNKSQPVNDTNTNATPETVASAEAPLAQPCAEQTGYQVLPAGVSLGLPYHLRADRLYTNKHDQARRRVVLELLEGNVDSTLKMVEESMIAAGFVARPRRDQPNGNIIIPYAKSGYGSITVVVNPLPGDNPSNPATLGTVTFDYPAGGIAPAATATAKTN